MEQILADSPSLASGPLPPSRCGYQTFRIPSLVLASNKGGYYGGCYGASAPMAGGTSSWDWGLRTPTPHSRWMAALGHPPPAVWVAERAHGVMRGSVF